jgi:hypothetical protein
LIAYYDAVLTVQARRDRLDKAIAVLAAGCEDRAARAV